MTPESDAAVTEAPTYVHLPAFLRSWTPERKAAGDRDAVVRMNALARRALSDEGAGLLSMDMRCEFMVGLSLPCRASGLLLSVVGTRLRLVRDGVAVLKLDGMDERTAALLPAFSEALRAMASPVEFELRRDDGALRLRLTGQGSEFVVDSPMYAQMRTLRAGD